MIKKYFYLSLIFFLIPFFSFAEENISYFDVTLQVNKDATINVTEDVFYNYDNLQSGKERHGLYRDIPYQYQADYGTFNFDFSDVTVNTDNFEFYDYGKYLRIDTNPSPDIHVSGTVPYLFKYKVNGAIGYFDDFDEIYWNTTGDEWEVPIIKASAKVILPQLFLRSQLRISCYEGARGSTEECFYQPVLTEDGFVKSVDFSSMRKYGPREGMTIAVGFPKGLVYAPTFGERFLKAVWENKIFFLPVFVLFAMFYLWYTRGRDPKGRGIIIPQYDAPDELSPMGVGGIYHGTIKNSAISAEIVDLAVNGYLEIEKIPKRFWIDTDDYRLTRTEKLPDDLKGHRKKLFSYLFSSVDPESDEKVEFSSEALEAADKLKEKEAAGEKLSFSEKTLLSLYKIKFAEGSSKALPSRYIKSVRLGNLREKFYDKANQVSVNAMSQLVQAKYFEGNPDKIRSRYISFGFLFLFGAMFAGGAMGVAFTVALILSALMIFLFSYIMPKMTEKGIATREYVLGFKEYLQIAEKDRINFHNAPDKNPKLFEKFLPYAMVLGVEKAWAKEFEGIYTTPPDWYHDPSGLSGFNTVVFANNMGSFSSFASSSLTSAPGGSGGSSGSGGGGFSGGGGGGGGGSSH